ncbi:hypothetical protein [Paraburkholderia sp. 32]|uniref:hypothetical protein n=1 Tax=Paraburkholderia sp. 32 TaxID=2991057 RepID=UPI003D23C9DE
MPLLTERLVRDKARDFMMRKGLSAERCLEHVGRQDRPRYDIFLSQTKRDAEIVLGVYAYLTSLGYKVFCDWIEMPKVDGSPVTPANAELVRTSMERSDTMLFIDSEGAEQSRWMCWELGWFDAAKGYVAILPLANESKDYYYGREFVGLYPYVRLSGDGVMEIVRPAARNSHGFGLLEYPSSLSFASWRQRGGDFYRPRPIEHLRFF